MEFIYVKLGRLLSFIETWLYLHTILPRQRKITKPVLKLCRESKYVTNTFTRGNKRVFIMNFVINSRK